MYMAVWMTRNGISNEGKAVISGIRQLLLVLISATHLTHSTSLIAALPKGLEQSLIVKVPIDCHRQVDQELLCACYVPLLLRGRDQRTVCHLTIS